MMELSLDMYQSTAVGAVVLILGVLFVRRFPVLSKLCVPVAVIGGLLSSFVLLVLHAGDVVDVTFDETFKNLSMTVFFCSIGFAASFKMLKAGGKILLVLVLLVFVLVLLQDSLGTFMASLFGLDPKFGLALGSISLLGGHGTAAAYGDILVNDYGLVGADVVAIASATFGLAIAGIIGGPLAKRLVRKHDLKPDSAELDDVKEVSVPIDNTRFLKALVLLAMCIGLGTLIMNLFDYLDIGVPTYLGALMLAIVVRNVADRAGYVLPLKEIEVFGWVCLCMFLSMALMALKLWQIVDLAAFMLVTLMIQLALLVIFTYYVVFKATGKNYESAALVAGVTGFGMGATPNAVANVEALMREHGPAPVAYFIVPIVGGVFLDLINVSVLTVLLNVL